MEEVVQEAIPAAPKEEMGQPQAIPSDQETLQQALANDDPKDRQWKELRRSRDEFERKSRMQEELLQRLMTQQMAPPTVPQPEEDVIADLTKDEYVSGEKVAKSLRKIEDKYEKKFAEMESKYKKNTVEDKYAKLQHKYSDFDDVVNLETIKTFAEKNPEIAETWRNLDDYSIAIQAYPLIKSSGIVDDVKGIKRSKEVEKKLDENKKTVQSPQVFDKRPMAQAFDYTKMSKSMKDELQSEMHRYGSLAAGVPHIG